ncbi:hypothetical protein CDIK_0023 [Cucumispora dikerogammari]|nr:hypothetical protein CDIK_0023 [Cucumispora dikerogammari]
MVKNNRWFFITTLAIGTGVALFAYSKYIEYCKKANFSNKLTKALEFMKVKDYVSALEKYTELSIEFKEYPAEYLNVVEKISKIYFELKKYRESLIEINKILQIDEKHEGALKIAFECNKELENLEEALKFFYKICRFDPDFIQKEKVFLKNLTNKKARDKMSQKNIPKDIYMAELKLMFPGLKRQFGVIDISKIYDLDISKIEEKEQEFVIFVRAAIENIKENFSEAKRILEKQTFLYSILLREQIDSQNPKYVPSKTFENIIESSQEPSVILYAAIIFHRIKDSREKDFIERGLKTSISYFFAVLKIQQYFNSFPLELAEKKVYKLIVEFKSNEHILIPLKTCITYFLSMNLVEFAKKYIDILDKVCPNSIFVLIYRGMFAEKINDVHTFDIYNTALKKMPEMYETNLRMGSFLMNKSDKSFINYIQKAYQNSTTFREAYYAYNIILSYEMFKNINSVK